MSANKRTYRAIYFDGQSAIEHHVKIRIEDQHLWITNEDIAEKWPLKNIKENTSAFPDRLTLRNKKIEDARVIVERRFRNSLVEDGLKMASDHSKFMRNVRSFLLLVILIIVVIAMVIFTWTVLPKIAAKSVPVSTEEEWSQYIDVMLPSFPTCDLSKKTQAEIDRFANDLIKVSGSEFNLDIQFVSAPFANAFASLGGKIMVTDKLIEEMGSPNELAGVLAHEFAHVNQRHVLESLFRQIGIGLTADALLGGSGISTQIARSGIEFQSLNFSRKTEQEADEYAISYLTKAQYDPEGLSQFFETLIKVQHGSTTSDKTKNESDKPDDEMLSADTTNPDKDIIAEHEEPDGKDTDDEEVIAYDETVSDKLLELISTHPGLKNRAKHSRALARAEKAKNDKPYKEFLSNEAWAELKVICHSMPEDSIDDATEEDAENAPQDDIKKTEEPDEPANNPQTETQPGE